MDVESDRKRKKDKHRDGDDKRKEKRSRRDRSRSPAHGKDERRKRRRSRSRSPEMPLKKEKENTDVPEVKKEAPARKNKDTDMLNTRTGGAYIPPARLRMMQAAITDKSSVAYQRLAWEALKKSIHGHINKINVGNIGIIIKELLKENIVRGRGLLCRSIIQAQAASPTFTNVYAALVSAINSRFPNIGELLLKRLVIQFKRGFKRNDKPICISSASFIAHLVNQRVAHEILALELLTLLVESPTDDSVEVSIAFLKECGQKLGEVSSKGVNAIFEMLRNILHEGKLDKRVQYMIEVMFQVWKDGFKDHPALIDELELVPEEEQFTHLLMLDEATDAQDILNVFKHDEKYEENEQKYKDLREEILGSDAESGEEGSGSESGSGGSDEEDDEDEEKKVTIIDNTETNLVALRRTIYLTINSSLDFEECAHKLMKMQLKPGQEIELCHMFLDCCAEQRTYEKFYGLLAQRFCNINRIYIDPFEQIFRDSYSTAHRLDTNRLRNVSKFFAHLLFTDSISWEVLECVKLNEEDTTSSSRIFIKILFQELAEYLGLKKLNDRLKDQTLQGAFSGVFPRDNPKNTRFSINFFTSIGLGGLTDELREHLKQMPKNVPPAITEVPADSDSSSDSSDSSSSSDSSDSSDSESEEDTEASKKKKEKKKKSKKTKSKSPEKASEQTNAPDKPAERWGHDGFYDTYGQDARRHEPEDRRSSRPERDDDNFVRPRDRDSRGDEERSRDRRDTRDKDRDNREKDRPDDRQSNKKRDDSDRRGKNDDGRKDRSKEDDESGYESRNRDKERNRQRSNYIEQSEDRSRSQRYTTEKKEYRREKDFNDKSRDKKNREDTESDYRNRSNRTRADTEESSYKKYKESKKRSRKEKSVSPKSSDDESTKSKNKTRKEKENNRDEFDIKPKKELEAKETKTYKSNTPEIDWDIHRESSIVKEVPTNRYWDIDSIDTSKSKYSSEERSSKRGSERRDNKR